MSTTEIQPPTLRFQQGNRVVPGDRIGSVRQVLPGPGTYAKGGNVYASVLGKMELTKQLQQQDDDDDDDDNNSNKNINTETVAFIVSIQPLSSQPPLASSQVIAVGQRVLGRVTRIAAPQASLEIIAMEGVGPIRQTPFPEGSISRDECVNVKGKSAGSTNMNTNTNATASREVQECFQPGDIVLAKVLSLGDARRYYLTAAEGDLGVIHAVCYASGKPMIPCSWKEMECPDTGMKELRKCAKPRKVTAVAAGI